MYNCLWQVSDISNTLSSSRVTYRREGPVLNACQTYCCHSTGDVKGDDHTSLVLPPGVVQLRKRYMYGLQSVDIEHSLIVSMMWNNKRIYAVSPTPAFWEGHRRVLFGVPTEVLSSIPSDSTSNVRFRYQHDIRCACHTHWPSEIPQSGVDEKAINTNEMWERLYHYCPTSEKEQLSERANTTWISMTANTGESRLPSTPLLAQLMSGFQKALNQPPWEASSCAVSVTDLPVTVQMMFPLLAIMSGSWSTPIPELSRLHPAIWRVIPHETHELGQMHHNEHFFTRNCLHRTWSRELEKLGSMRDEKDPFGSSYHRSYNSLLADNNLFHNHALCGLIAAYSVEL